jgi:hypothetical protein
MEAGVGKLKVEVPLAVGGEGILVIKRRWLMLMLRLG